jgi:hypothetical protein
MRIALTACLVFLFPELTEDWPFFWYENEYVVDTATSFIVAANVADALTR